LPAGFCENSIANHRTKCDLLVNENEEEEKQLVKFCQGSEEKERDFFYHFESDFYLTHRPTNRSLPVIFITLCFPPMRFFSSTKLYSLCVRSFCARNILVDMMEGRKSKHTGCEAEEEKFVIIYYY
jgi:hypothetical protein